MSMHTTHSTPPRPMSAPPQALQLPVLLEEPESRTSSLYKSHNISPTEIIYEKHEPGPKSQRRISVFGDIPTEAFGPSEFYAFQHAPQEPGGAPRAPERMVTLIARRVHGWTWQAFPIAMGTSAVYVTMSGLPERSNTLRTVETIFFFLNVFLFSLNLTTLAVQAILYPRQAKRLFTDSSKNIFIPLVVLNFATIIIGIINYGVTPGIVEEDLIYVLFWIYVVLAVGLSFPLLMIWFNEEHDVKKFTPAWMFFMFPIMLTGVVAFNALRTIDPSDSKAVGVLFLGYFFQGIGFFVTMFYICIYFLRIMMTGFMDGHQANGAFVAAGPPGFTALALINLGSNARKILPLHGLVSETAGEVWYAASLLAALMLYGLAVFLFLFGALPYWFKLHKHLNEILGCWALTFPNVGWIATTGALGNTLNIRGLLDVQIAFVIIMAVVWVILAVFTIVAFKRGLILIAKPEDVIQDRREKGQVGIV